MRYLRLSFLSKTFQFLGYALQVLGAIYPAKEGILPKGGFFYSLEKDYFVSGLKIYFSLLVEFMAKISCSYKKRRG